MKAPGFALRQELGRRFRGVINIFIRSRLSATMIWCSGDAQVAYRNALEVTKPSILEY